MCVPSSYTIGPGLTAQIWRTLHRGVHPMSREQHQRREFIQGLRAVAEFYEKNPSAWYDGMHLTLNMYVWGRAARKALIETARLFGHCNKIYDETNITVSRQF